MRHVCRRLGFKVVLVACVVFIVPDRRHDLRFLTEEHIAPAGTSPDANIS